MTKLSQRERNLLLLCFGVIVLVATALVANVILQRRADALHRIALLETQRLENMGWMNDREFWEKRRAWLEENMPATESVGRAQGQLLEQLQNEALDRGITIQQQTLPESVSTGDFREVTVNLRLRGEQPKVMEWLSTMQSPEKFQAIKAIELELDSRAREATPQALCNLTIARWFKPAGGL